MTPAQRRQLIEKRQQGTLTDEENQQYQELLRTDSSFYEDVNMYKMLADVLRQEADQQLWEAVGKARAKARKRSSVLASVWRYPYMYAMAACVALLIVGIWIFWFSRQVAVPQVVKIETNYLFRADTATTDSGRGYAGGRIPIGRLPVKWIRDEQLTTVAAYHYCQDTLTIFIRNNRDTLYLQNAQLRYNTNTKVLSVERPNQPLTTFNECVTTPQPF